MDRRECIHMWMSRTRNGGNEQDGNMIMTNKLQNQLVGCSTILHFHVIELGLRLTDEITANEASNVRDKTLADVKSTSSFPSLACTSSGVAPPGTSGTPPSASLPARQAPAETN